MKRIIIGICGASAVGLGVKFAYSLPNELEKHIIISSGANAVFSAENHSFCYLEPTSSCHSKPISFCHSEPRSGEESQNKTDSIKNIESYAKSKKDSIESNLLKAALKDLQNAHFWSECDLGASICSGSFVCEAMAIVPTSANTLAKIAAGIADTSLLRAAAVQIKEQRKLLLALREMPLCAITLENAAKLARLGVCIAPPVFAEYPLKKQDSMQSSADSMKNLENFFIGKWLDLLGLKAQYNRWNGDLQI